MARAPDAWWDAVARRWVDQFSNVQNAVTAYEALLEADGNDEEAQLRLKELYLKRRSWPQLFTLYEKKLPTLEGKASFGFVSGGASGTVPRAMSASVPVRRRVRSSVSRCVSVRRM